MSGPARPEAARRTGALALVGAWTLVGLPLAWGVWQVVQRSLALFR